MNNGKKVDVEVLRVVKRPRDFTVECDGNVETGTLVFSAIKSIMTFGKLAKLSPSDASRLKATAYAVGQILGGME